MVCLSEGMTLTIHIFQMKLFTSIAATALVFMGSVQLSTPAKAQMNGWVETSTDSDGMRMFLRNIQQVGPNRYSAEFSYRAGGGVFEYNCNGPRWKQRWVSRHIDGKQVTPPSKGWNEPNPGTLAADSLEFVCTL